MLCERLKKLRRNKKRTQQEMADFLGVTRPAYTAYESGKRQPDYETLEKLSNYFDVSIDYLLTGKEHHNDNRDSNLFFFDIEGLDDEEIEDIKRHIEYVKWKASQERKNE